MLSGAVPLFGVSPVGSVPAAKTIVPLRVSPDTVVIPLSLLSTLLFGLASLIGLLVYGTPTGVGGVTPTI